MNFICLTLAGIGPPAVVTTVLALQKQVARKVREIVFLLCHFVTAFGKSPWQEDNNF
jgi:hypothetical protein